MIILSSLIHPHVVPKLYDFLSSLERVKGIQNTIGHHLLMDKKSIFFRVYFGWIGALTHLQYLRSLMMMFFC